MDNDIDDGYTTVKRLVHLRDFLHSSPRDLKSIQQHMKDDYAGEGGKRKIRRDIHNLGLLGFQIDRLLQPIRWVLTNGLHILADSEIDILTHIRELFPSNHPLSPGMQTILDKLTAKLPERQHSRWQRRPPLRSHLTPAIDYSDCNDLLHWLEERINERTQIAFYYHTGSTSQIIRYGPLDPYDIEYTDRHFYLLAYTYEHHNIFHFRLDRIIRDTSLPSPERLPTQQRPRRVPKPIRFTYRIPIAFARNGVSERFITHSTRVEGNFVIVEASDPSDFRIIRTLLAYGEHGVLLDGPPELMEKMRNTVRLMCTNYG